jgi:hypothetical protein
VARLWFLIVVSNGLIDSLRGVIAIDWTAFTAKRNWRSRDRLAGSMASLLASAWVGCALPMIPAVCRDLLILLYFLLRLIASLHTLCRADQATVDNVANIPTRTLLSYFAIAPSTAANSRRPRSFRSSSIVLQTSTLLHDDLQRRLSRLVSAQRVAVVAVTSILRLPHSDRIAGFCVL